jgi:hypothetical protein
MRTWPSFLSFQGNTDGIFRALTVAIAALIIVKYSALFEEDYSIKLADLYIYPWWRMLVVLFVITSIIWSPYIGIIIGLIVFFYLSDMNILINPISNL